LPSNDPAVECVRELTLLFFSCSRTTRVHCYEDPSVLFTQTDPLPRGAGSVFEGAFVYTGNRPTAMVDLSGLRNTDKLISKLTTGVKGCQGCDFRPRDFPQFDLDTVTYGGASPGLEAVLTYDKYYYGAAAAAATMPLSSFMMQRYLANTGQDIVWDYSKIGKNVVGTERRGWNNIFEALNNQQKSDRNFHNALFEGTPDRDYEGIWGDINFPPGNHDLQYSLNEVNYKVITRRSPSGKWCRALWLADRYNFDINKKQRGVGIGGFYGISDEEAARLAQWGMAQSYNFFVLIGID
jgi:hypothetical protein